MNLSKKTAGFSLLLVLGVIIALAPVDKMADQNLTTDQLLQEWTSAEPYIHADRLAHWIINDDPGFQVIDLRPAEDYKQYHIPGNQHVPFNALQEADLQSMIDPYKIKILVSNGNTRASQAWLLLRRMGYENLYVLKGGMNYWVDVFNSPEKPGMAAADDEIFKYQFRKSAGAVMMGRSAVKEIEKEVEEPERPVKRIRRPRKKGFDEGC